MLSAAIVERRNPVHPKVIQHTHAYKPGLYEGLQLFRGEQLAWSWSTIGGTHNSSTGMNRSRCAGGRRGVSENCID
eukprot:COSAG02_NODE_7196_length_3125_cov_1.842697_5_plen_76_part_00